MATSASLALLSLSQLTSGVAGYATSRRQAQFQEELAAQAVNDRRREGKRLLARQRVAFAKSGVDIATGSPLDYLAYSAGEEELSALRAGLPAEVRANQYRAQGVNALIGGLSSAATTAVAYPTLTSGAGGSNASLVNVLGPSIYRRTGTGRP